MAPEQNPIGQKYAEVVRSVLEANVGQTIGPEIIEAVGQIIIKTQCEFVGIVESAVILEVSRQRAFQLEKGAPAFKVGSRQFWFKEQIVSLAKNREGTRALYMGIPKRRR